MSNFKSGTVVISAVFGLIASVIAIYVFVTGRENLPDALSGDSASHFDIAAIDKLDDMFTADEVDIYVKKSPVESYIFFGKHIDVENIAFMEADYESGVCIVHFKDGSKMDLGVRLQWMVKPYIFKSDEVSFVRTKDGSSKEGTIVPLVRFRAGELLK